MDRRVLEDIYRTMLRYAAASGRKDVLEYMRSDIGLEAAAPIWGEIRGEITGIRERIAAAYKRIEEIEACIRLRTAARNPVKLSWPEHIAEVYLDAAKAFIEEANSLYYKASGLLEKTEPASIEDVIRQAAGYLDIRGAAEKFMEKTRVFIDASRYLCSDELLDFIVDTIMEAVVVTGGYRRLDPVILASSLTLRPVADLEQMHPQASGLRAAMVRRIIEYIGEALSPA